MRLLKRFSVPILGLVMSLVMSSIVRADAVTDWNAIAIQIIARATTHPGATSFLDSAIVQAAVYDAVESITKTFRPYAIRVPGASGLTAAAVAKATRDVLMNRFPPGQFPLLTGTLDATYNDYLSSHGISPSDPGIAVGAAAAAAIIALRANDGSFPNCAATPTSERCDFAGGNTSGQWRPTPSDIVLPGAAGPSPPPFAHMLAPWLATVTPFTLNRPDQFRAPEPPSLTSKRYAAAFNEVKRMGARTNSDRRTIRHRSRANRNANTIRAGANGAIRSAGDYDRTMQAQEMVSACTTQLRARRRLGPSSDPHTVVRARTRTATGDARMAGQARSLDRQ